MLMCRTKTPKRAVSKAKEYARDYPHSDFYVTHHPNTIWGKWVWAVERQDPPPRYALVTEPVCDTEFTECVEFNGNKALEQWDA